MEMPVILCRCGDECLACVQERHHRGCQGHHQAVMADAQVATARENRPFRGWIYSLVQEYKFDRIETRVFPAEQEFIPSPGERVLSSVSSLEYETEDELYDRLDDLVMQMGRPRPKN